MSHAHPRALLWILCALVAIASPARAQEIPDIDYENLSFRGLGLDWGWMAPDRLEPTQTWALRVDLGYAGPGLRILPSISYWKSPLEAAEIAGFEDRIEQLVFDQTGVATTLDLGSIEYADIAIGLDGQVVWELPLDVLTYMGLGITAHVLNGSGAAIEETVVEDMFDSVTPGFNLHVGGEYPVTDRLRVYSTGRYEVMPDFRHFRVHGGLQIMLGPNAPGEGRGG